ncbi:MAG: aspartate 1-decarboxylase [Candidatus Aureabacteria bacterium]|nr:aspartate 1-decarboxylase [Candidatus Auribacterota bacterium]
MLVTVLKSKIHRAILTDANLHYAGSMGIDSAVMKKASLIEYERILVINLNTGERFETYCIAEPEGSGKFALYGGAARLGMKGDPVIIMAFAEMTPEEAKVHKPITIGF